MKLMQQLLTQPMYQPTDT